MIVRAIYDTLLLPGVNFILKKELFEGEKISKGEEILYLMQKEDKELTEATADDFYPIGLLGECQNVTEEGNINVSIKQRVYVYDVVVKDGKVSAEYTTCVEEDDISKEEAAALYKEVQETMISFIQKNQLDFRVAGWILYIKSLTEFVCSTISYMNVSWEEKYALIETSSKRERMEKMKDIVYRYLAMYEISEDAQHQQKLDTENAYKEMALKKQIEYLQNELDEMHPENITDVRKFEKKIQESGMNEEARAEAEKILNRMKQEGKDGHEYGSLYDYLDFVTSLAWKSEEPAAIDLEAAETVLNENHYGLEKPKKRIIEQLAVMSLNHSQSGSILLFVGAPGTGKTSIGKSIAKALGREYVRISLGGVRDEAEIRGHRRTYVGAMPGRIMEGMRRSGVQNPVVVLDEIDKLAKDYSGDPASALLEVLDPEQNNTFTDHYMNVPYDLSKVLFICTANSTETIPEPLLNRMEIIRFQGYTPIEKFHIAKEHLLPLAMQKMGMDKRKFKVTDQAIEKIIEGYTAEAGVRGLKKQMEHLCRHAAVKLVKGEQKTFTVNDKKLEEFLDAKPWEHENLNKKSRPGIVTGLAWTQAGGEILFIETVWMKGIGKIQITGQLGDVMKESAQIAVSLVKMKYPKEAEQFEHKDLHIHVPAGAVPKDGPSAGITLVTALASLITGKQVRADLAMTGEVSLRGYVMPIGGLPEKLMAAQRAGVRTVLIPKDNVKDLDDVAEEVKEQLEIIPVTKVEDVLKRALEDYEADK